MSLFEYGVEAVIYVVFSGFDLPCTEDAPTCLETCGQMRECGRHLCTEHCHVGPCSTVCVCVYIVTFITARPYCLQCRAL